MAGWLNDRKNAKEAKEKKLEQGKDYAGDVFAKRDVDLTQGRNEEYANRVSSSTQVTGIVGGEHSDSERSMPKSVAELLAETKGIKLEPEIDHTAEAAEVTSKIDQITGTLKNKDLVTKVKASEKTKTTSEAEVQAMARARTDLFSNAFALSKAKQTEKEKTAGANNLTLEESRAMAMGRAELYSNCHISTSLETAEIAKKQSQNEKNAKEDIEALEMLDRMTNINSLQTKKGEN